MKTPWLLIIGFLALLTASIFSHLDLKRKCEDRDGRYIEGVCFAKSALLE